jgi:hypothetical protein
MNARPIVPLVLLPLLGPILGCALQYVVPEDTDGTSDGATDGDPLQCEGLELACDGTCVDVDEDENHCGRCDAACGDDQDCVSGECVDVCGFEACGTQCIDIDTDPANCGMCGRWCDSSSACVDGACVQVCAMSCDSDAETCIDGACVCRDGLVPCDGECVDSATDDQHCGMCGQDCDDDEVCNAGECDPAGCGALDQCEDSCTDLDTDPLNCGVCERTCHASQACVDGVCTSPSS